MVLDGLTWKEQAEALASALIENQSLDFLQVNEQGKTDAVSGVSISIGGFTALAEKCLKEAAGITQTLELKDGTYEAKAEAAGFARTEEDVMTYALFPELAPAFLQKKYQ